MLDQLRAIDMNVLTEVVRQDQESPAFHIDEWQVDYLSHKGVANPEGLFRFSGSGYDANGKRPWSLVLKILRKPAHEQNPRDVRYWKRELLVAEHNLLPQPDGPLVAPRIYAIAEYVDSGWLWMEHIVEKSSQPWTLDDYAFAARALGYANGLALIEEPSPDYPWLCTEHCRWWIKNLESRKPEKAWENPVVNKFFSGRLRTGWEQLWAEREDFFTVLSQVPQHFSHFDVRRGNLFIRKKADQNDELVAIDWAFAGNGALGGDLFALVVSSTLLFELDVEDMPELEAVAMDAYLQGLSDSGWTGNTDLARLGYTAWFAVWFGMAAPIVTDIWSLRPVERLMQLFDRGAEECARAWAQICEIALDRADEARQLTTRLAL
jgi:hypothetical protein